MKTLVLTAGGKKENLVYNFSPHNKDFEKKMKGVSFSNEIKVGQTTA